MKNKYYDPFEYLNVQKNREINEIKNVVVSDGIETEIPKKKTESKRAYLLRVDNNKKTVINKSVFTIGKSEQSNYVITGNNAISRTHAEILLKNNSVYVVDKKSTNKTFVNGTAIQPETEIKISNGDKIKFANVEFILSIE